MDWKFEYILQNINPDFIREVSRLDDNALKLTIAGFICKVVGGLKYVPQKGYQKPLAKELIKIGTNKERVLALTGIKKSTYYKLKGDKDEN